MLEFALGLLLANLVIWFCFDTFRATPWRDRRPWPQDVLLHLFVTAALLALCNLPPAGGN